MLTRINCGARNARAVNRLRRTGALAAVALCAVVMFSAVAAFRAEAVPGSILFSAIGDYGDGSTASGNVAALVDSWAPDFVIAAGDNRYGATTFDDVVGQFYCDYLTDVGVGPGCAGGNSLTNAFFPAPGNHDYDNGGGIAEYLDYFTLPGAGVASSGTSGNERYYDFVIGNVHFFALDSQGALLSVADMDAQKAWLQAQLAASTSPFQVVFLHHPPYSSGAHGSTAAMQWPFAAWGADAVIAGHDHTYERIAQDGIPYFVDGLGGRSIYGFSTVVDGSQVRYNGNYGAMRITADASQMTFEFGAISGEMIDSFATSGGATPPPAAGTVERRILFGPDDVEENNDDGSIYTDSSDLELGSDPGVNGTTQTIGLRFQYLYIPQGVKIKSAYLEFTVDEVHNDTTDVVIHAQSADNAGAFSTTAYDVTSRPLAAASVPWSVPLWDTVGAKQQSPDISAVLQEIVDRAGWSANNSVVLVIDGTGHRTADSYEGSPGTAPLLHVEYRTPSGC